MNRPEPRAVAGGERIVRANGVDLCVETFGARADPANVLFMGAAGSMLLWEDEFCERLAAGSRFVIRYDHRDTGRSITYEPGAPQYIASSTNHFIIEDDGGRWRARLGEIQAPTLVIHGTEDPLFPIGHAVALANEIPGAQLLALDGPGHELARLVWDVVIPAVLRHTARA